MLDSGRTPTYPRDRRGYQTGPDLITALGVFGKGKELPMLSTRDSFSFGRLQSCDLCVEDETHVSALHAQIDRLQESARASLKVTDVSSGKNDIVFLSEIAEKEFTMGAGDWFDIGDTRFFALNEQMRLARPTAMDVLGLRQHVAIDDLLITAVRDLPGTFCSSVRQAVIRIALPVSYTRSHTDGTTDIIHSQSIQSSTSKHVRTSPMPAMALYSCLCITEADSMLA